MKTDRELLELAAKAAGVRLHHWNNFLGFIQVDPITDDDGAPWTPLTDDGDVLRLAVHLNLLNDPRFLHERDVLMFTKNIPKLEATRRAIVRVAAAIGESMQ